MSDSGTKNPAIEAKVAELHQRMELIVFPDISEKLTTLQEKLQQTEKIWSSNRAFYKPSYIPYFIVLVALLLIRWAARAS